MLQKMEIQGPYRPDPHQEVAIRFHLDAPSGGSANHSGTGQGKGFVAIACMAAWDDVGLHKQLAVVPAALTEDWRQKLLRFAGVKAVLWDDAGPDDNIRIISHSLLANIKGRRSRSAEVIAWRPDVMVVDEAHRFKSYSALQTSHHHRSRGASATASIR
jgi:hypothetical protein